MTNPSLADISKPYLDYLEQWTADLPALPLAEAIKNPEKTAIISVDVIKGFCYIGPLSSPRVAQIVKPIVTLMKSSWEHGLRNIVLTQDSHEENAVEFGNFPPHCIRGTEEAETVDAIQELPFFDQIEVIEKNSIASGLNTGLNAWVEHHPEVDTFIIVGDCTDLCTYQLAMHLRLDANARQIQRRVILPVDCVDTYDTPLEVAKELGIFPHPANILHPVFLNNMAINGIEVVAKIVS